MRRIILFAFVVAAVTLLSGSAVMSRAHAFDVFQVPCNNQTKDSAVCQDKKNGNTNPLPTAIRNGAAIIAVVAGVAGVGVLLFAGLTFVMANGDASKVKQAQQMVFYTIVGLVIIALADSIVSLVLLRI